ncbi:hypothetical protein Tco_0054024 [Tanacetum coccineum]
MGLSVSSEEPLNWGHCQSGHQKTEEHQRSLQTEDEYITMSGRLPLLSAAIMSSTPDPSTLTYDTILKESNLRKSAVLSDTMANVNVNAPAEQAPAVAPPTRTDDQILPRGSWVPVGMKDEAKNVSHLHGQKLSRQAKINLDYRPVSPEPASGSLLAKRMLVSLSHDQTNGVKDQKEERGK